MWTGTADCGQEKLRTFTSGLSPADWPKIFDSSPQFLHRAAVRSFSTGQLSAVRVLYGDTAFHIDMSICYGKAENRLKFNIGYGHEVRRYQSAVYPARCALSIAPCTKRAQVKVSSFFCP
ncbi:hypothetical protein OUZ56_005099 [Daphnia magna]|uniref:Uncharacterized protein n=1 Tax=Daphnia magna TaxID=35525 RepID=A0ABQ9YRT7_9CRUS|nr:hypothetical protein OUZ56_005099 [Daphnia magna]